MLLWLLCLPFPKLKPPRFGINGVAHCQKNLASCLRSPVRTVQFGVHFVDICAALDLGLPPGPFIGYDSMSDVEAATFFNGFLDFC